MSPRLEHPHQDPPRPLSGGGGGAVVSSHSFVQQCQKLINDRLGLRAPHKGRQHRSSSAGGFTVCGDNGDRKAPTAASALEALSMRDSEAVGLKQLREDPQHIQRPCEGWKMH